MLSRCIQHLKRQRYGSSQWKAPATGSASCLFQNAI